jgi:hypothetical protein
VVCCARRRAIAILSYRASRPTIGLYDVAAERFTVEVTLPNEARRECERAGPINELGIFWLTVSPDQPACAQPSPATSTTETVDPRDGVATVLHVGMAGIQRLRGLGLAPSCKSSSALRLRAVARIPSRGWIARAMHRALVHGR